MTSELAPWYLAEIYSIFSALCASRQQTSYVSTLRVFRTLPSGAFVSPVLHLALNLRYENYIKLF
jgi:hypothetical protein